MCRIVCCNGLSQWAGGQSFHQESSIRGGADYFNPDFVGLDLPERHIARVAARVARGGHDIPEGMIRARYDSSRKNLLRLMPVLDNLAVSEFDPAPVCPPNPYACCR